MPENVPGTSGRPHERCGQHMTPTDALLAILARIRGQFDHPALVAFGPLADTLGDIESIAEQGITFAATATSAPEKTARESY